MTIDHNAARWLLVAAGALGAAAANLPWRTWVRRAWRRAGRRPEWRGQPIEDGDSSANAGRAPPVAQRPRLRDLG